MCGVIALLLANVRGFAAPEICEGLNLLQHRGQDACGVVTCGPKGRFYQCKSNGMVRDVLTTHTVATLIGSMGIGHVRYPTAGSSAQGEAQPFYVNAPFGLSFAHNGNLINTPHLRYFLDHYAHRHINTDSDSELLLNVLADNLQKTGKFRIDEDDIFRAIGGLMKHCHGAYACVSMLAGFAIIAFRDPNGIRPLGYGRRKDTSLPPGLAGEPRYDYMMASESVACDANGFTDWRDVQPGEAVIITRHSVHTRQVVPPRTFAPDIFEFVYFARPDSVIDGISVYRSRMAMGDALAKQSKRILKEVAMEIDVVIPVPDTSRVAALQAAQGLGLPFREGLVKNRYIGRTFIMPGQSMRRKNVRRKLNAMALEFDGKNVMLVDDSIVRGTTSREIIQMAREAGAKKVVMASCVPPIRFPNVFGIDMPSRNELVAHGRTEQEIAEAIGADLVIFQQLDDLIESCRTLNPIIETFDCSVFTGKYVTGGVDQEYLDQLENRRNDNAKIKSNSSVTANGMGTEWIQMDASTSSNFNCNGPMNGSDAIGLMNEQVFVQNCQSDSAVGLYNSFHSSVNESVKLSRAHTPLSSSDNDASVKDSLRVNGADKDGTVGGMVHQSGEYGTYIPATPPVEHTMLQS